MTDDVYTVTLTSITAEEQVKKDAGDTFNEIVFSAVATPVSGSDGQYTADLQITQGGTYDVLITMENTSTAADSEISTIVSDDLTLVITDTTSVPSKSLIFVKPAGDQIDSGDMAIYKFRSRDAKLGPTYVTTDTWTLTLTCQSSSYCGDQVYTYTATPGTVNGQYFV